MAIEDFMQDQLGGGEAEMHHEIRRSDCERARGVKLGAMGGSGGSAG